jgi:hypothetical protein
MVEPQNGLGSRYEQTVDKNVEFYIKIHFVKHFILHRIKLFGVYILIIN